MTFQFLNHLMDLNVCLVILDFWFHLYSVFTSISTTLTDLINIEGATSKGRPAVDICTRISDSPDLWAEKSPEKKLRNGRFEWAMSSEFVDFITNSLRISRHPLQGNIFLKLNQKSRFWWEVSRYLMKKFHFSIITKAKFGFERKNTDFGLEVARSFSGKVNEKTRNTIIHG